MKDGLEDRGRGERKREQLAESYKLLTPCFRLPLSRVRGSGKILSSRTDGNADRQMFELWSPLLCQNDKGHVQV